MKHAVTAVAIAGIVALGACSDPTQLEMRGGVAVSFATRSPTLAPGFSPSTAAVLLDDTLVTGSDTLIITRARLVLRDIELKPQETVSCDGDTGPGCEEIELGPFLVELPLAQGAQQEFAVEVPAGAYSRIDFEVHKVGDDPADLAFLTQHPEFEDISIRVDGSFNGSAFVFTTDLNEEQELTLVPPLVVTDTTSTNVTILVVLDSWFRTPTGALVDPATANKGGANEGLVTENIKQSLDAFEDPDSDGSDD
jgi:hypothetical protein